MSKPFRTRKKNSNQELEKLTLKLHHKYAEAMRAWRSFASYRNLIAQYYRKAGSVERYLPLTLDEENVISRLERQYPTI